MNDENQCFFTLPSSCPYTISLIDSGSPSLSRTWLIREHDEYGEYPHIYAKVCRGNSQNNRLKGLSGCYISEPKLRHKDAESSTEQDEEHAEVIILSDTGCGTEKPNQTPIQACGADHINSILLSSHPEPKVWNLSTFLEYTLNPGGHIPYLVITTHCHYDHIMGMWKLPPTSAQSEADEGTGRQSSCKHGIQGLSLLAKPTTTVLSSSHSKSFVTPYTNLQNHSLCATLGLQAPRYEVGIWAQDMQRVVYRLPTPMKSGLERGRESHTSIPTSITILHMPGHTPDSLAWYDADTRMICIGDSFYLKETPTTRGAPWEPEPPMPTIFTVESNLADWWKSVKKVLAFIREMNAEFEQGWRNERVSRDGGQDKSRFVGKADNNTNKAPREKHHVSQEKAGLLSLARAPEWYKRLNSKQTSMDAQTGFNHFSPNPNETSTLVVPEPFFHTLSGAQHRPAAQPFSTLNEGGDEDKDASQEREIAKDWILVDMDIDAPPRVSLCAAHTTVSVDAESATLAILSFIASILHDEVPCRRVGDGSRGEERWLWDYALTDDTSLPDNHEMSEQPGQNHLAGSSKDIVDMDYASRKSRQARRQSRPPSSFEKSPDGQRNSHGHAQGLDRISRYEYSVLSPLCVIEEGRRTIPRCEWDAVVASVTASDTNTKSSLVTDHAL